MLEKWISYLLVWILVPGRLVCLAEEVHQWKQLTMGFSDVPDKQLGEMRS